MLFLKDKDELRVALTLAVQSQPLHRVQESKIIQTSITDLSFLRTCFLAPISYSVKTCPVCFLEDKLSDRVCGSATVGFSKPPSV